MKTTISIIAVVIGLLMVIIPWKNTLPILNYLGTISIFLGIVLLIISVFEDKENEKRFSEIEGSSRNLKNEIKDLIKNSQNDSNSKEYFKELKSIPLSELTNKAMVSSVLSELGRVSMLRGEYDSAISYFNDALKNASLILERPKFNNLHAVIYTNLATLENYRHNDSKAIFYYEKAETFEANPIELAVLWTEKAGNLQTLGRTPEAIQCYEKALKVFSEHKVRLKEASVYDGMARIFRDQSNFKDALTFYLKAQELYKTNPKMYAANLIKVGAAFKDSGDYVNAKRILNEAVDGNKLFGDKMSLAYSYGNLGVVAGRENDLDNALIYHNAALELFKELKDEWGIANETSNLASIYLKRKRFKKALTMVKKALQLHEKVHNSYGKATSLQALGVIYYYTDSNKRAIETLYQSKEILKSMKHSDEKIVDDLIDQINGEK